MKKLEIKCETHDLVLVEITRPDFEQWRVDECVAQVSHEDGCTITGQVEDI